jgi:hypothetical protein
MVLVRQKVEIMAFRAHPFLQSRGARSATGASRCRRQLFSHANPRIFLWPQAATAD